MAIRVQRHANVSKQATLLDGLDLSRLKWSKCGCGLDRFVHEGMNHVSNVEVHLKTRSGNVNMSLMPTSSTTFSAEILANHGDVIVFIQCIMYAFSYGMWLHRRGYVI